MEFKVNFNETNQSFKTEFQSMQVAGVSGKDAVLYTPQSLTEEQKAQARANIDALPSEALSDEASLAALIEMDMLPTLTSQDGAILTDKNGSLILRYF